MSLAEQITQLEAAIAGLEAQRALLGDQVIEAALGPLRTQLVLLKQQTTGSIPPPPAAPAFEGERKLVTIMFADISGFTALSEKMDPEQVRSLMNACFDHLVPTIGKYGGVVDKFIGDEIMALFGAPTAHENDAERALRAALEMADLLADFNHRHQTNLGLHFGINTGTVIAGGMGSQRQQQYSVIGDPVNLASRLEDASERGDIFVGTDTHRLTAPLFEFEALAPIHVKGKTEPVPAYRLLRAKAQPGRVRGLAGLESPMVGRSAELHSLLAISEAAAHQSCGSAVAILGEPGLGKTRLISEWKAAAAQVRWAEGRCLSYGQGLAYHLLVDLLRSLAGVNATASEVETHQAIAALCQELFGVQASETFPYLAHLLSLHLEGEALECVRRLNPQALQEQYLAALSQTFNALAAHRPLGLILEDIHWADPSSTDLLIKLLALAGGTPLLFCFVTRPEQDAPGWQIITALREKYTLPSGASLGYKEITLAPLSDADSRQLVTNLLEIEALPDSVRSLILKKAEGNPFFVEEVVRMLIEHNSIVRQADGRWLAAKEIDAVEIPDTLQGLLLERIDRLPEEVRRTLRVASVIGRQFSVRVLEQVLQQT